MCCYKIPEFNYNAARRYLFHIQLSCLFVEVEVILGCISRKATR